MVPHCEFLEWLSSLNEKNEKNENKKQDDASRRLSIFIGLSELSPRALSNTVNIEYQAQIDALTFILDQKIRFDFMKLDLFDIINPRSEEAKKVRGSLAENFNHIALRVTLDVLTAKDLQHAAMIYAFWVDMAICAGSSKKNLYLERAIISGLMHFTVNRIFDHVLIQESLPKEIQNAVLVLEDSNRCPNTLVHQKKYFLPGSLYGSLLEINAEAGDHVTFHDGFLSVLSNMHFFQQQQKDQKLNDEFYKTITKDFNAFLTSLSFENLVPVKFEEIHALEIDKRDTYFQKLSIRLLSIADKKSLLDQSLEKSALLDIIKPESKYAIKALKIEKMSSIEETNDKDKVIHKLNLIRYEAEKIKTLIKEKDYDALKKVFNHLLLSKSFITFISQDYNQSKKFNRISGLEALGLDVGEKVNDLLLTELMKRSKEKATARVAEKMAHDLVKKITATQTIHKVQWHDEASSSNDEIEAPKHCKPCDPKKSVSYTELTIKTDHNEKARKSSSFSIGQNQITKENKPELKKSDQLTKMRETFTPFRKTTARSRDFAANMPVAEDRTRSYSTLRGSRCASRSVYVMSTVFFEQEETLNQEAEKVLPKQY